MSSDDVSATYAKEAGLVAEPNKPFNIRPNTNNGKRNTKSNKFFSTKNNGVIIAINDAEYPRRPRIAIFLLPYLSLALPHAALVKAQPIAENANIEDVCTSDKPNSLARGGTITKTND